MLLASCLTFGEFHHEFIWDLGGVEILRHGMLVRTVFWDRSSYDQQQDQLIRNHLDSIANKKHLIAQLYCWYKPLGIAHLASRHSPSSFQAAIQEKLPKRNGYASQLSRSPPADANSRLGNEPHWYFMLEPTLETLDAAPVDD